MKRAAWRKGGPFWHTPPMDSLESRMIRLLADRYQLTDSTLCRITFTDLDGGERALNLGSSTFAPGKVGSWTYVNLPGEREVYSVEGLLTATLRVARP